MGGDSPFPCFPVHSAVKNNSWIFPYIEPDFPLPVDKFTIYVETIAEILNGIPDLVKAHVQGGLQWPHGRKHGVNGGLWGNNGNNV